MLGLRHEFTYSECAGCGCLSLVDAPDDLSQYYPVGYYSLESKGSNRIRDLWYSLYLSPLSPLVNWRPSSGLNAVRYCRLRKHERLLDVGCGTGYMIQGLRQIGYQAEGIDPFIQADVKDGFGIRVKKLGIEEVQDRYHMILFHHSLEHIQDQIGSLTAARKRLLPGGTLVVSIPVVGWAWRQYNVQWVQLDAPRHFFLHTVKSFHLAAEKAGLRVDRVVYESDEFQFWGSELYQRDKPLRDSESLGLLKRMRMRRRAAKLNKQHDGDEVQFYLHAAEFTPQR